MTIERTCPWEVRIVVVIIFKPAESRRQVRPSSREFADILTVGEIAFEGGHNGGFVGAKDPEG